MSKNSPENATILDRPLAEQFEVPSYDDWRQEAERLLKGAPFDKRMYTATPEGITLRPIYCRGDISDLPGLSSLPGEPPFVRGQRAVTGRWLITQRLDAAHPAKANAALRHDLPRGLGAVILDMMDERLQRSYSADQLQHVFDAVDPTSLPVFVECGDHPLPALAALIAAVRERELPSAKIRGAIAADPVGWLLRQGRLDSPLSEVLDQVGVMTAWGIEIAPSLGTVWVHGDWHNDGGATAVQELAAVLATGLYYLKEMEDRSLVPETVLPRLRFSFGVGTSLFMEIAKLRAFRLLWQRLLEVANVDPDDRRMWMHARTSQTSLSSLDPHTNLLRLTTSALAAAIAGVDSIEVDAFDLSASTPDEFARRLSRNTQLVLAEEVHLDTVTDPSGGCWYIEWLTHELAARSWDLFREIDDRGGMVAVVTSGWWQDQISQTVHLRRAQYAKREAVLVGTSKYPSPPGAEKTGDRLEPTRIADETETLPDSESVKKALRELKRLEVQDTELVEAAIAASRSGATALAIANAVTREGGEGDQARRLELFRAAEPFERIYRAVRAAADSRPNLAAYLIGLGPMRQYMPRVDFAVGFMEVGGFEVRRNSGFEDVSEATKAFGNSDCGIALICGTDDTYAEQAVPLVESLKKTDPDAVIVLAGLPPDKLREALEAAGVDFCIHLGSDVPETLGAIAGRLGVSI